MKSTKIFDSTKELSGRIGEFINTLTTTKQKINIAISGGSTPEGIFNHICINFKERIDWNKINFFWADERCVPPDHPDSNFRMTNEKLLQPLGILEEQIFRIKGESDPNIEAIRYSDTIKDVVDKKRGLPAFDLILLGIGEDGHTASIFPDQLELLGSNNICEAAKHPDTGQNRITLTGKTLNNADYIIFHVMGVSKRHIVKDILYNQNNWMNLPAACIQPVSGKLQWFLDRNAGRLIK